MTLIDVATSREVLSPTHDESDEWQILCQVPTPRRLQVERVMAANHDQGIECSEDQACGIINLCEWLASELAKCSLPVCYHLQRDEITDFHDQLAVAIPGNSVSALGSCQAGLEEYVSAIVGYHVTLFHGLDAEEAVYCTVYLIASGA